MHNPMNQGMFECIKDPETAEEYVNLGYIEQFGLQLKWINEEFRGRKNHLASQLQKFDKSPEKLVYKLVFKDTKEVLFFETKEKLKEHIKITDSDFSYLKKMSPRNIKKPKNNLYFKYQITPVTLKLKGNQYVLLDEL